jgi:NAD(P)H dehydrogenase (quinone)
VSTSNAFAEDIKDEIAKLRNADLILFEFPLWWSAPPAILKGWLDKVFALGVAWDSDHRYDKGLLAGKKALVIVGAGDPESNYTTEGIHGATITQHLYPLLHSTLAQSGMDVISPFIATGLTTAGDQEVQEYLEKLDKHLANALSNPDFIYKH